ncbi:MAG: hypothetical protein R2839_08965 [Thermomicrobiales bacterium]
MSAETKQRTRRQVIEEARLAALEGRWNDAIDINRELINRDAKDTEAHNRLGRALMETHDYTDHTRRIQMRSKAIRRI